MAQSSNNSDNLSEIDKILCRAEKLREKSLYRQALRLFKKALQGYRKIHDREGLLHCMISLGDIYRMVGNFDLAARSYKDTIKLASQINPVKVADAQVGLGLSLRAQGKWKEAIKLIRKSKSIYKKKDDRQGIAFTLWAEAGALRIKGDIRNAIRTFKESYTIFKAMKDPHGVGYCLCGLGGTSRIAGLFRDSLNYYKDANKLFSSIDDTFGRAYSYCGIGNAYRMLSDYDNAFTHFSKAVRLYKKIGDKVSYAYTLWGLGTAYKMASNIKKTHYFLMKARQLFQATKDPRGLVYCRLGFGEIALLKGNKAIAKRHLLAARKESKKNNFAIEGCYADTLISFMNETNPYSPPFRKGGLGRLRRLAEERGFSRKIDNTCYNQLGLKIRFQGLPFNIP